MRWECPYCMDENDVNAISCHNCGAERPDISAPPDDAEQWMIVCPVCGTQYTVWGAEARIDVCTHCDDPFDRMRIADVAVTRHVDIPVRDESVEVWASTVTLTEVVSGHALAVPPKGGLLGRQGNVDANFFLPHGHVARRHCRIYPDENGVWRVEHYSETTPTEINGLPLLHNRPHTLRTGDQLLVADLLFKVQISSSMQETVLSASAPEKGTAQQTVHCWQIKCTHCGTAYEVQNEYVRMERCLICIDEFDALDLAKVNPEPRFQQGVGGV